MTHRLKIGVSVAAACMLLSACASQSTSPSAAAPEAAAAASASGGEAHGSNDRTIEIKAEADNLWHLYTRSRLVHMRLDRRTDGAYVEMLPFNYNGVASPFADNNNLSLEIDPGTDSVRVIKLLKEGSDASLVSAEPLPGTGAFDASLYMDEGTHYHRLRFRFPGAP